MDVAACGLIYAGAQKNIGPAGVTLIIVRDDLLDRAPKNIPGVPLQAHGGQPFVVQYTARVFDLRHRAHAEVDQGRRRAGRNGAPRDSTFQHALRRALDGSKLFKAPVAATARA